MNYKDIDNNSFASGMTTDGAVVLDVRTPAEFAEGRIPGSLNIDFNNPAEFIPGISELDKSKTYYIYCRSGARSAGACHHMGQMGFQHLYNLQDGILGWDKEIEK